MGVFRIIIFLLNIDYILTFVIMLHLSSSRNEIFFLLEKMVCWNYDIRVNVKYCEFVFPDYRNVTCFCNSNAYPDKI